jgi:hypothetical protein
VSLAKYGDFSSSDLRRAQRPPYDFLIETNKKALNDPVAAFVIQDRINESNTLTGGS